MLTRQYIEDEFDIYLSDCEEQGIKPEYTDAMEWWDSLI